METIIEDGARVLFQGDSVTGCDRNRSDPHDLGRGFAMMAASWFSALYPEKNITFINRGVSGDRTKDLVRRWDEDCLALRPQWVSVLIGINNMWRRYDSNDPTPLEQFEAEYREILDRTKRELNAKLILCEPFLLHISSSHAAWREDLDPKIDVVHRLAREHNAILIALDRIFIEASTRRDPAFWAPDGVHPSLAGHALIAQTWLKHILA
ncbi:MAG: SGNH/GDSL hydrolase family protein [Bacteroidota bacterium]